MIFDAELIDHVVSFKCALEDYDEGPTFYKNFALDYMSGKDEGDDRIPVLKSGPWYCENGAPTPPWALRLAKVLEPRIEAMLLTGRPQDLRRWIDDELLEELEKEKANEAAGERLHA